MFFNLRVPLGPSKTMQVAIAGRQKSIRSKNYLSFAVCVNTYFLHPSDPLFLIRRLYQVPRTKLWSTVNGLAYLFAAAVLLSEMEPIEYPCLPVDLALLLSLSHFAAVVSNSFTALLIPRSNRQQYVKNVLYRAIDEVGNLRANRRLRESLDNFTWPLVWPADNSSNATIYSAISSTLGNSINNSIRSGTCRRNDGVIGLLSDLVTVPDLRIARALSHKRRAALSTVIVDNDNVVFDFRRRGIHTGPVNFLPLSMLRLEKTTRQAPLQVPFLLPSSAGSPVAAADVTGERSINSHDGGGEADDGASLLPLSPETPVPAGFLGYAVRLLRLRPEHESLRWTVLFAVFKDLVVFETTEEVYQHEYMLAHVRALVGGSLQTSL